MRLGFFTTAGFSAPLRAAVLIWLACFNQALLAQVSDGQGLTPLEGVLPITDDRALWDSVKDSRDANELRVYLKQFPNGLFAALANLRVRTLEQAAVAPVAPPAPLPLRPPPPGQRPSPATGQTIKDCADCPEMVVLAAGSFEMGSPPDPRPDPFSNAAPKTIGSADEKPQRRVQIAPFAMGKYEVTQEQWYAVMGANPSYNKGRTLPVEAVGWEQAQVFIQKLNQKTGQQYRLPSEAEWEYAARAGSQAEYSFGDDEKELGRYAWYGVGGEKGKTHPVGEKQANRFGLHDMHGNVWEWVQDCWHDNYNGAPTDGSAWTTGCKDNNTYQRTARGGSWANGPSVLRSAIRVQFTAWPGYYINADGIGLRLARTLFTP